MINGQFRSTPQVVVVERVRPDRDEYLARCGGRVVAVDDLHGGSGGIPGDLAGYRGAHEMRVLSVGG
jgi:hypothetical protein